MRRVSSRHRGYLRPVGWSVSAVVSVAAGGCEGRFEATYEWRGRHIDFVTDAETPPCAGTARFLDDYTAALKQVVGEPEARVYYRWTPSLASLAMFCPPDHLGCSVGRTATSLSPVHLHEIVHAVEAPFSAAPAAHFLREGLAMILGDVSFGVEVEVEPLRALAEMDAGVESLREYGTAAHFTSFLVSRFGLEAVREAAKAAGDDAAAGELIAAFGVDAATLFAEYRTYPLCPMELLHVPLVECMIPPEPRDADGAWRFAGSLECAEPRVVGPHEGRVTSTFAFEFLTSGAFEVELREEDPKSGTRARLTRCAPCEGGRSAAIEPGTSSVILERGRYYVVLSQRVDAPSEYDLVIRPLVLL